MKLGVRIAALVGVVAVTAAGAMVATATATAAASPTATFVKVSDWGTGWEGRYTITNGGSSTLNSWQVEFDLPTGTTVGSYWNALMNHDGQHYRFTNQHWNGTITPGASVTFGFLGAGSGSPSGCRLNGQPCTPTAPPTTSPPPTTAPPSTTPVAANGQLRVCGQRLCNEDGKQIQLRGEHARTPVVRQLREHGLARRTRPGVGCGRSANLDVHPGRRLRN